MRCREPREPQNVQAVSFCEAGCQRPASNNTILQHKQRAKPTGTFCCLSWTGFVGHFSDSFFFFHSPQHIEHNTLRHAEHNPVVDPFHGTDAPWMATKMTPEMQLVEEKQQAPEQIYQHQWNCDCGTPNDANSFTCTNCRRHPPTWSCVCHRVNPGNRSFCGACRRQRGVKMPQPFDHRGLPMITAGGRRRYDVVRSTHHGF